MCCLQAGATSISFCLPSLILPCLPSFFFFLVVICLRLIIISFPILCLQLHLYRHLHLHCLLHPFYCLFFVDVLLLVRKGGREEGREGGIDYRDHLLLLFHSNIGILLFLIIILILIPFLLLILLLILIFILMLQGSVRRPH